MHAFIALAAGFFATALVIAAVSAMVRRFVPGWASAEGKPAKGYLVINLGASFLAAAAGGYIAAWAARENPLQHVEVLAIILLGFAALSAMQSRGKLPTAYLLLLVAITPFGALAGGLAQLRVAGIL